MRNDIRARRTERRWSQAELGKALGVSRQTVIALENDKYDPSLPLAFRIAALCGCSIEAISPPDRAARASPPRPALAPPPRAPRSRGRDRGALPLSRDLRGSAPAREPPVYRHNRGLHVHSSNARCLPVGRPRTLGRAVTSAAAETPVTRGPRAP